MKFTQWLQLVWWRFRRQAGGSSRTSGGRGSPGRDPAAPDGQLALPGMAPRQEWTYGRPGKR